MEVAVVPIQPSGGGRKLAPSALGFMPGVGGGGCDSVLSHPAPS